MSEWESVPELLRQALSAEIESDAARDRKSRRHGAIHHGRRAPVDKLTHDEALAQAMWRYTHQRAVNRARGARRLPILEHREKASA